MNQSTIKQDIPLKTMYEEPRMDIIQFSCADIITTSGDPDQGEWDPQCINDDIVFSN